MTSKAPVIKRKTFNPLNNSGLIRVKINETIRRSNPLPIKQIATMLPAVNLP